MRILILFFVLLLPTLTEAHPGHGSSTGNDWLHYLTSSGHVAPAILAATVVILFFMLKGSSKKSIQKNS